VEPRFGRLYSAAVLRPFAEQLVDEIGVRSGDIACDLLCDAGTLGVAFGFAVGTDGQVVLVDSDADLLATAAHDVAASGCAVATSDVTEHAAAVADGSCNCAGSLFTFGFWDGADQLDEVVRILAPGGVVGLLVWDRGNPPPHERVLLDALRTEAGMRSPFLERCLPLGVAERNVFWEAQTLHDVVQFDGIAQYWAAMVLERPVATELARAPATLLDAVRNACERGLSAYIAADGTMRIPVTATMLRYRRGT
jgi:hypothetical protein